MKAMTLAMLASLSWTAAARAAEPPPDPNEPPELSKLEAEMMPSSRAPAAEKGTSVEARLVVAQAAPAPVAPAPRRDVAWRGGKRAPIYVGVMLLGEGFVEDEDYRLTTRESRTLEGGGGLFRMGGVLGLHDRVGLRLQSFVRPTKKVLTSTPQPDEWGVVALGYVGPEYLHSTDSGFYFGGSIGLAGSMSQDRVDCDGCDCGTRDSCGPEQATGGVAVLGSVGYELRTSKWFALSAEAFLGVYHGIDDDENAMNTALFGLGVGVGF